MKTNAKSLDRLQGAAMLAFAVLLCREAHASGAYMHAFTAEEAARYIGSVYASPADPVVAAEIQTILQDRIDLFKFASLFPDNGLSLDDIADGIEAGAVTHSAAFLNAYAEAIRQECFPRAFGKSCKHRPDLACNDDEDCEVDAPSRCTGEGHPICDATGCPGLFNTCNENNICDNGERCCHGVANICADAGVCSEDYMTPCFQGGTDCDGALNLCVDDYGDCEDFGVDDLSNKCERLITHFMGTMAHIVTDYNFDTFFVQTVEERPDCPPQNDDPFADCEFGIPLNQLKGMSAQAYTDQEMDGYLGREHLLYLYFPTSISARHDVEDRFLMDVLDAPDLLGEQAESIDFWMTIQWITVRNKVDSEGRLFDGFECTDQPDAGTICDDFDANLCPIRCSETAFPSDCPGFENACNEVVTHFCAEKADCCKDEPCCTEEEDYCGRRCRFFHPVRRQPYYNLCDWAISTNCATCPDYGLTHWHWYTEAGGVRDNARLIADMIVKTWSIMRRAETPHFAGEGPRTPNGMNEELGVWPGFRICVGSSTGPDCQQEQTIEVIGTLDPGKSEPLPGALSLWSNAKYVTDIAPAMAGGHFRFLLRDSNLWVGEGSPSVVCNPADARYFDLDLNVCSDDAGQCAAVKLLTDTVYKAFIEQRRVQVQVDPAGCSANGVYLVKAIRIAD